MAKDKSEKKEKKEKKKEKLSDDGVKKSSKKDKKREKSDKEVSAILNEAENGNAVVKANGDSSMDVDGEVALRVIPKEALVPFANPLADEKQTRKVLKSVKKATKHKVLKRGVKEVVKCVRKIENSGPANSGNTSPPGVVILAADISPMDVLSHIPVLCEDNNIPYIYVQSRAELGMAGNTKRPTSVVMVAKDRGKGKEVEDAEYKEAYADLVKMVLKAGGSVRI